MDLPRKQVIDLHGQLAIPGFIEGHGHFTGVGEYRLGLDLREARTWDQIVAQVARAAKQAKPGEWILGRGWHQEKWATRPIQTSRASLSTPRSMPCRRITRCCSPTPAATLFSSTPRRWRPRTSRATRANPSGGEILKDAAGAPTGLLRETAQQLANRAHEAYLAKRTPEQAAADLRKVIEIAAKECLSKGITTFEDAGSPLATADMFRDMAEHNELPLRLWVMLRGPNDLLAKNLDRYRTVDVGQNHLAIRAIKRYMDGALGSRGAWLLAPYTDKPDSTGLNSTTPPISAPRPSSPSRTTISSASTPSATAPTAKC